MKKAQKGEDKIKCYASRVHFKTECRQENVVKVPKISTAAMKYGIKMKTPPN